MGLSVSKSAAVKQMMRKPSNKENAQIMQGNKNGERNATGRERNCKEKQQNACSNFVYEPATGKHLIQQVIVHPTPTAKDQPSIHSKGAIEQPAQDQSLMAISNHSKVLENIKKSLHFQDQEFEHGEPKDTFDEFPNGAFSKQMKSVVPSSRSIPFASVGHSPKSSAKIPRSISSIKFENKNKIGQYTSNKTPPQRVRFSEAVDWRSSDERCQSSKEMRHKTALKSITLSNKFAEMGSQLHECDNDEENRQRFGIVSKNIVRGMKWRAC